MKKNIKSPVRRLACLVGLAPLSLAGCIFWTGCATSQQAAWSNRVGNLTYEQAVTELGPPNKTNSVTDGGLIAQWVTGRTTGNAFNAADDASSGPFVGYHPTLSRLPSHVLALEFGPDHKLVQWAKVVR